MDSGILAKIGFDLEVALANFINFLIIFLLFKIFLFKPIQNIIDKRREEINSGIENASKAQISLQNAQEESEKIIKEARREANDILISAKNHADEITQKAISDSKIVSEKMIKRSEEEIEQSKQKMKQDVEKEMTHLVSTLAEKVVRQN